jgi:large subunit ribosomal protein L29
MAINKDLTNEEMLEALAGAEKEYIRTKFDHAVTALQDPSILGKQRKEIARMQTELRSRELAAAPASVIAKRSKIRARRRK